MKQISDTYSFPFVVIYRDIIAERSDKLVFALARLGVIKLAEVTALVFIMCLAHISELHFIATEVRFI
jgi:hypothetical protein